MARLQLKRFGEYGVPPSLLLPPVPLWPGVVEPDGVLSMSQIEETLQKSDLC